MTSDRKKSWLGDESDPDTAGVVFAALLWHQPMCSLPATQPLPISKDE